MFKEARKTQQRRTRRRAATRLRRAMPLTALAAVGASAVGTAAVTPLPAPVAPHKITVGSSASSVVATGYAAGQPVTVNVLRADAATGALTTVGSATTLPADNPATAGFDGIVDVNHPGGACWEGQTPNMRPGDIVRLSQGPFPGQTSPFGDQTTVADVTVTPAVRALDATGAPIPGSVVVHGTAQDAAGAPLPIGLLGQRLTNAAGFAAAAGSRALRAPGQGTIDYDAPGSVHWTASYTGLAAADVDAALAAGSDVSWSSAAGTETTTAALGRGIVRAPMPGCTAPLEGTVGGALPIPPGPNSVPLANPVDQPPVAGRLIAVSPQIDAVTAQGFAPGVAATVNVLRANATTGALEPVGVASTQADATGLLQVNEVGGACWEGQTPDIRPGDLVRVTQNGAADQTRVANVTNTLAVQTAPDTVVMHGTAQDAAGAPLPIAQLEARVINGDGFAATGGGRSLRTPANGTLSYDAAGSTHWTATFAALSPADVATALAAQARGFWLGAVPAAVNEQTISSVGPGIAKGPVAPCSAPLEGSGPTPAAVLPPSAIAAIPFPALAPAPVPVPVPVPVPARKGGKVPAPAPAPAPAPVPARKGGKAPAPAPAGSVTVINRANGLPVVINTLLIDPAVNLAQIQAKGVTVTIVPAAGTKLIRFRIFAPGGKGVVARAGHRHGRLIAEFFRTVNGGRRIQMHLRGAAVRRLKTGRYELEATPGVSRRSLGRPVTREFRVQR